MATLECTVKQEGSVSIRRHFLNLRDTKRVNTFNSRCFGF